MFACLTINPAIYLGVSKVVEHLLIIFQHVKPHSSFTRSGPLVPTQHLKKLQQHFPVTKIKVKIINSEGHFREVIVAPFSEGFLLDTLTLP